MANATDTTFHPDAHDLALFRYVKSGQYTLDGLKAIWAKRNACDPKYIDTAQLVRRMIIVATGLGLASVEDMVLAAAPGRQWMYGLEYDASEAEERPDEVYYRNWAAHLCSLFANTEVARIPGWEQVAPV